MFFFIGGVQPRTKSLDRDRPRTCPSCGRPALGLRRTDHYLSMFFIPLFPVKKGRPFWVCADCGTVRDGGDGSPDAAPPRRITHCASCGRPIQDDFEYCPYCGKPLSREDPPRR